MLLALLYDAEGELIATAPASEVQSSGLSYWRDSHGLSDQDLDDCEIAYQAVEPVLADDVA
jgi:hypothetical protein